MSKYSSRGFTIWQWWLIINKYSCHKPWKHIFTRVTSHAHSTRGNCSSIIWPSTCMYKSHLNTTIKHSLAMNLQRSIKRARPCTSRGASLVCHHILTEVIISFNFTRLGDHELPSCCIRKSKLISSFDLTRPERSWTAKLSHKKSQINQFIIRNKQPHSSFLFTLH
jgi:hypothetical protein